MKKTAAALTPTTFNQWMQLADTLAKSSLVPKDFRDKPGDCLVAMQMGASVGLNPFQAIQSIAVINGRPAMWGDAVLGIVMASGLLEDIDETDDGTIASCTVKRKGKPTPVQRIFSRQNALEAKVYEKDGQGGGKWVALAERAVWRSYPQRMRQMRARSWALRDAFPDVLKGLAVREEVEDYGDSELTEPKLVGGQTFEERMAEMMPREKAVTLSDGSAVAEMMKGSAPAGIRTAMSDTPVTEAPPVQTIGQATASAEDTPPGPADQAPGTGDAPPSQSSTPAPPAVAGESGSEAAAGVPPHGQNDNYRPMADAEIKAAATGQDGPAESTPPQDQLNLTGGLVRTTRFTIGKQVFETAGIIRKQMVELFDLCPKVGKKYVASKPYDVLVAEFGLEHRADLTEDQAEQYTIRLKEMLEND